MNYGPDFSSSDDEFEGDFEFQEFLKEKQKERNMQRFQLTDEQKKEVQLRNFYLHLMNGKVEEVLSELNEGIDVNQKLQNDWNPILIAASTANYGLVKALHDRGADAKSTRDGQTTLMLACSCPENTASFEESAKVVELFLNLGVNPNVINRKRMNALMFAANNGNLEVIKMLCPGTDLKAEDNQNWNALFWAVNSGKVKVVEYLLDKGLSYDKVDVRGNTPLDLARDNDFNEIVDLFSPEEDVENTVIQQYKTDFESIFRDLKKDEKPQFFLDICNILHGTRCESLIKLFADKKADLLYFLSSTEDDLKALEVQMPFQRRRLMTGIHRFHKYAYHPKSLPTVGKNEIYSNMDAAAAILSTVKQVITMEASLKYLSKNIDDIKLISGNRDIRLGIQNIEQRLRKLKLVSKKLSEKATSWDCEIEPPNVITSKSGKRWFPWRKTVFISGIIIIISINLWNKPSLFKLRS